VAAARRGFLKAVAIAPVALGASPAVREPAAPAATAGENDVAGALAEAVRLEHGPHLDDAALARVKKEIAGSLESAARLRRAVRPGNADEPVTLFHAVPPSRGARR
jgi:hypothetical protein